MITLIWFIALFIMVYSGVLQGITILGYIGQWKVFKKAGYEGWEAIVPFYNTYVLFKIVFGSGWFFLLSLIPIGGLIATCIANFQLGKRFGKSTAFCVGMLLFPSIFTFILGIEKPHIEMRSYRDETGMIHEERIEIPEARYQPSDENGKKAMILSSSIVGGVCTLIGIIISAAIVSAVASSVNSFVEGIESSIEDSIGGSYDNMSPQENEPQEFGSFGYEIPDNDSQGNEKSDDFKSDDDFNDKDDSHDSDDDSDNNPEINNIDDLEDLFEQYGIDFN